MLHQVVRKGVIAPWREGEPLVDSAHQVHARNEGKFVDLLFEPREGDQWVYRRNPTIRMPLAEVERRFDGVPYLAPEVVLFFKSQSLLGPDGGPRVKDEADFDRVLPHLGANGRAWLRNTLSFLSPSHPWSTRLQVEADTR